MTTLKIHPRPRGTLIGIHAFEIKGKIRTEKNHFYNLSLWIYLLIILASQVIFSQTIMFDDFDYNSIGDQELYSFNKWNIIEGVSGPPEGALYSRNNINFIGDPNNSANTIMTLKTSANGQTGATTHARIETSGFEYFEGTYAARVYLSDESFYSKDANIQTFYTIVSSTLAQDGSKYSEMDIMEYIAADKWGVNPDNRVGYTTSYHKYIANPWIAWKTYSTQQQSLEGWHTFVATCIDGINIRYYMDNILIATHAVTDNTTQAGLSVYPRSTMQVAFANWIWNSVLGNTNDIRENTFMVDWVLHYKNTALSTTQVDNLVTTYRSQGLKRRNLRGQTFYGTPLPPDTGITTLIEAEDNVVQSGTQTEACSEGGLNVGYIDADDWMVWDVNLPNSGRYLIEYRVASLSGGGTLQIEKAGGVPAYGILDIPNTGGWQNWTTIQQTVNLDLGAQQIAIKALAGGWNINWLKISTTSALNRGSAIVSDTYTPLEIILFPNPTSDFIKIEGSKSIGSYEIFNSSGKIALKGKTNSAKINIGSLKAGIYYYKDKKTGVTKQFIKN